MKMNINIEKSRGFTLIELLVVIAIIGILTTLGMISINTARLKSRDSKRWSDIRAMQSAIEVCINNGGSMPVPPSATWNDLLSANCGSGETLGTYFASQAMPVPPQAGTCADAPSGDCYMYCATATKYVLYSKYEGDPPAGGLSGAVVNYDPATECVLSMNAHPTGLPSCNPAAAGSFCLGSLSGT